jgi:hypothetical protein
MSRSGIGSGIVIYSSATRWLSSSEFTNYHHLPTPPQILLNYGMDFWQGIRAPAELARWQPPPNHRNMPATKQS